MQLFSMQCIFTFITMHHILHRSLLTAVLLYKNQFKSHLLLMENQTKIYVDTKKIGLMLSAAAGNYKIIRE